MLYSHPYFCLHWLKLYNNYLCQGEEEHRRVKGRYSRASKNHATGQIVKLGIIQDKLMRQALELTWLSIDVKDPRLPALQTNEPSVVLPTKHHYIAVKDEASRTCLDFAVWLCEHKQDVAIEVFELNPVQLHTFLYHF
jgi:hypothetical protein